MDSDDLAGPAALIVPYPDGPLLVRGDFELRTPDGERIEPGRGTVALCRCGRSAVKPFCDGTHKAIRWRATAGRENTEGGAAADDEPAAGEDRSGPVRNEAN